MALLCCCRRPPAYSAIDPTDDAQLLEDMRVHDLPPDEAVSDILRTAALADIPTGGCVYCGRRAPLVVGHPIVTERRFWATLPPEHYIVICACPPVHVGCAVEYVAGFPPGTPRVCARCHEPLRLPRAQILGQTADCVLLPANAEPDDAPDQWSLTVPAPPGRPWRGLRLRHGHVDVWPCDNAPAQVPPDYHALINLVIVADGSSNVECLGVEWADLEHILQTRPPKLNAD